MSHSTVFILAFDSEWFSEYTGPSNTGLKYTCITQIPEGLFVADVKQTIN